MAASDDDPTKPQPREQRRQRSALGLVGDEHEDPNGQPRGPGSTGLRGAADALLRRILGKSESVTGVRVPVTPKMLAAASVRDATTMASVEQRKESPASSQDRLRRTFGWELTTPNPRDPHPYGHVDGSPFAGETPRPEDVQQGDLGDCYFLSALIAIDLANPHFIERMVHDNGDGTYDIMLDFLLDGHPRPVRVDASFPLDADGQPAYAHSPVRQDAGRSDRKLWPMLIEKAFALATRSGTYEALWRGGRGHLAMEVLGVKAKGYRSFDFTAVEQADMIERALARRQPVTAGTMSARFLDESDLKLMYDLHIMPAHNYAVSAIDLANVKISLINPIKKIEGEATPEHRATAGDLTGSRALDFIKFRETFRFFDIGEPIG